MPCTADDCNLCKSVRGAVQADLNAAANIGLRALLDPDFPGKWWFVPCGAKDGKPVQDQVKGSACFADKEITLLEISNQPQENKPKKEKNEITNAWRDPSAGDLSNGSFWKSTTGYWNIVHSRAIRALRIYNGLNPMADKELNA